MKRHGWRIDGKARAGALALLLMLLVCALPARALAFDSPLEPVTPASDAGQHGLGLVVEPQPKPTAKAMAEVITEAADLPASIDLTPWAMPVGNQGQVNSCAAWAIDYSAMGYWMNKQGIAGGPLAPMFTYSQVTNGQNVGTTLPSHTTIAMSTGVDNLADYTQGNYNLQREADVGADRQRAAVEDVGHGHRWSSPRRPTRSSRRSRSRPRWPTASRS